MRSSRWCLVLRGTNTMASGGRKPPDFRAASGGLRPPLAIVLVPLMMSLTGCNHVFHIATDSVIRTEVPLGSRSRVITETPPVSDSGPVVEMPLGSSLCSHPCKGDKGGIEDAKVAVVDVDGLLLNMDMTGLYSLGENPVSLFREKLDAIADDPRVCRRGAAH